jgi:Putative adhesin
MEKVRGKMTGRLRPAAFVAPVVFAIALSGCGAGAPANGSFSRTLNVSGPIRLEVANAAGDVAIGGSTDGRVHVKADVRSSGFTLANPRKRVDELVANPPIEQKGDTIRIGKDLARLRNITVSYTIEVPRETEVSTTVASGSQTVHGLRGPVKLVGVSGAIRVNQIEGFAQLTTVSGSIDASDMGDDVRATSASGKVTLSNVKGDVSINAVTGSSQVTKLGGRVEATTTSGSIDVAGAKSDVKIHAASGHVTVQGDPGANTYWNLNTVSGPVRLSVPQSTNFHLSAEAVSGQIQADIPIVIEEQGKHSLRARMGDGGGRVEVHTVTGEIRLTGAA